MLRSGPKLTVHMNAQPQYATMGFGATSNLFLLGHADGLPKNTPIKITSMIDAVRLMESNLDSPLLQSALVAYYSGARDIWLVSVAPMEEYAPMESEDRNYEFYELYRDRLNEAYSILENWEVANITVPIGAPFNDYHSEVDFFSPLVRYCSRAFAKSGEIHLGLMGTEGPVDQEMVNQISSDARIKDVIDSDLGDISLYNKQSSWANARKFVSVFAGDVIYNLTELPGPVTASGVIGVAGVLSTLGMSESVMNKVLPNAARLVDAQVPLEIADQLADIGINAIVNDTIGRRGMPFRLRAYTDNTLSRQDSIFWSLGQLRMTSLLNKDVRGIASRYIGSIDIDLLRQDVQAYLTGLVYSDVIRQFDLYIERDRSERYKVNIHISVRPFFTVRNVDVSLSVGPIKL